MRALAQRGDVAEALRVYAGLQAQLRDELGTAPSAQTQLLHEQLLRGVPAAAAADETVHDTA
jgi:DNA-binding SARP family transcriptional activator